MRERQTLQKAQRVNTIRVLQNAQAEKALVEAMSHEQNCLDEKENTHTAMVNAHGEWKHCLQKMKVTPEYLQYFSEKLLTCEVEHKRAILKFNDALLKRQETKSEWQICQAQISLISNIQKQLQRKISRLYAEKTLSIFEERVALKWSRK